MVYEKDWLCISFGHGHDAAHRCRGMDEGDISVGMGDGGNQPAFTGDSGRPSRFQDFEIPV